MRNDHFKPESFEEFWPYYLGQHEERGTRLMHLVGTGVALASLAAFALTKRPAYLATALVGSYGPAWLSHAAIEKNEPATFTYPAWSLLADLRMFKLWAEGQLDGEIAAQKDAAPQRRRVSCQMNRDEMRLAAAQSRPGHERLIRCSYRR